MTRTPSFIRTAKRTLSVILILLAVSVMTAGCDLFRIIGGSPIEQPLQQNEISPDTDGKELDLLILGSIFPQGLKNQLDSGLAAASEQAARSFFQPSKFVWNEENPEIIYNDASGTIRIPEKGFLEPLTSIDPTVTGSYFTITPTDEKRIYRIVYTIERNPDLSSLDRTETAYFVAADSWDPYTSVDLKYKGWEAERVYYRDGKLGDRTSIAVWTDEEAKGAFIAPDYGPFSQGEIDAGVNAIFTIDINRLYGDGGRNHLDYYFQRFWNQAPGGRIGDYSSFTRTYVFPEKTEEFINKNAISEQNDYYTEVGITSYPRVLGIPDGTPGNLRASISYYMRPPSETPSDEALSAAGSPLRLVNAGNTYYDQRKNFLMRDVKTLEHYPGNAYPYLYRHRELYYDRNGILVYTVNVRRYPHATASEMRKAGINAFRDLNGLTLRYYKGTWEGIQQIASGTISGQRISFNVYLRDGVLGYTFAFGENMFRIVPEPDGTIRTDLPGGGTFEGSIDLETGLLSGTYTSADLEVLFVTGS